MVYETASNDPEHARDKWALPSYRAFVRRSLQGGRMPEHGIRLTEIVENHDRAVRAAAAPDEPLLTPTITEIRQAVLLREERAL